MNAPISSPTSARQQSGSTSTQSFAQPPQPQQQQQQQQHKQKTSGPSTDVFIQNLNLVAEAAKRAEMAVLMRDMESIGLS